MARAQDFDLAAELAKPSFTPARRDAPALVELIVDGDDRVGPRATAALVGLGPAGRAAVEARLDGAGGVDEGGHARLVVALGLLARTGDAAARQLVLARVHHASARVRRAAAVALGKLGGDDARAALIARWDAPGVAPDERRALAEALGKVGGDGALARLNALDPAGDPELARLRDRAVLMADRTARRGEDSSIAAELAPPRPLLVRLRCRPALGELLHRELVHASVGTVHRAHPPDAVDVELTRPWSALFASRLWASAAIRVPLTGLPDRPARGRRPDEVAAAVVAAMTSADVLGLLRAWTRGPIRWRLGMAHGHQRSLVWRIASEVTRRAPELINDPTATTWDVLVDDAHRVLELTPRRIEDPRFAYRVADVPAASHPSVAAALALVAEARAGDRVWDPFCGSGLELIERARRGAYASLRGSDLDEAALAAARANLAAAGVDAELARADARAYAPGPIDLILTNPPLGSRVQLDAAALLGAALPGMVRQLAPGGRLVWITPAPTKTGPVLEQLGLARRSSLHVDLGGVRGRLERWDRR